MSGTACPDANTLNELACGTLDDSRRVEVLNHLDACAECRRLAAAAAVLDDDASRDGAKSLRPGDTFGRYVILGVLGAGAMGIVYAARDDELSRKVALKLVRVSGGGEQDVPARERLLREAKAAASLSHPNVVVVHEVGTFQGRVFIAMEHVETGSLADWLAGDRRAPADVIAMYLHAGEGLAAAHEAGLVHRDFKPDNVLVGKDGRPRVADFGVARRTSQATAMASADTGVSPSPEAAPHSETGAVAGTPAYMAPELLRGGVADARSDQFSFAVSLYESLYGERPPLPKRPGAVSRTLDEPSGSAQVPAAVRRVLLRALRVDPSERFPDMRALLRALEEASAVGRAPRPGTGRALALGLGGLAAVVLLGVGLRAASRARPGSAAPSSSASVPYAAPGPTRLTDWPVPPSDVAEARAEYVAGVQGIHDASAVPGLRHLVRATELDPSMAAAHLRLAAYGHDATTDARPAAHFTRARELHALLSPRDEALLTALEPSYLAVPPDDAESTRRMRVAAARWPLDVELQYLVAARERDPAEQARLLDHVLDLDPAFALALWRKANIYLSGSDFANTMATLDRCLEVSSSSTACLTVRALVDEELGRCTEMERDARVLEMMSPTPRSHDLVARALYANGAPLAAVREALARKWSAAATDRDQYETDDEVHLAILAGDFGRAERLELDEMARVERSPLEDDHRVAVMALVWIYQEMGEPVRAARLADWYLKARVAWQPDAATSTVPILLAAVVRAGMSTETQRQAALLEWRKQWDGGEPLVVRQAWVWGYAMPAMTPAEAVAALAAAPQPLPRAHTNQFHREGFGDPGKVLFLAGRPADALPLLRAAAATCSSLPAPLDHTWARANLGMALEATGNNAGACREYRAVLDRWGAAKPRSVTAEKVAAHAKAIGCREPR
jgi:serine/threonine-protein kinase